MKKLDDEVFILLEALADSDDLPTRSRDAVSLAIKRIALLEKVAEQARNIGTNTAAAQELAQRLRDLDGPPTNPDDAHLGEIVLWNGREMVKGHCISDVCLACDRLGYHLEEKPAEPVIREKGTCAICAWRSGLGWEHMTKEQRAELEPSTPSDLGTHNYSAPNCDEIPF